MVVKEQLCSEKICKDLKAAVAQGCLLKQQRLFAFFASLETALICVGRKKKLERSLEGEKTVTQKKEAKPSVAEVKTEQPSSPATPTPAFSLSGSLHSL